VSASVEIVVAAREHGTRLDVALGSDPRIGSRAAAQALIERGLVSVDGRPRAKRYRLSSGEHIRAWPYDTSTSEGGSAGGVAYGVCYEDDHLLVVDKPAGLVVHPAPAHPRGTLVQALADRAAGGHEPWRPGIVHRLDRDTSGLLVVAKSDRTHRELQQLIRQRRLVRRYSALVSGHPEATTATIDAPIGRDRRHRTQISVRSDRPREARTHFWVVEIHRFSALLGVGLETGRTHQIRAHLAAIGHPICGDRQYGGGRCGERLELARQFLHAEALVFDHPISGERLELHSKLPADLANALARVRREQG
jgi:23S rRNA pseudouridine1911/1915/1917 synthase